MPGRSEARRLRSSLPDEGPPRIVCCVCRWSNRMRDQVHNCSRRRSLPAGVERMDHRVEHNTARASCPDCVSSCGERRSSSERAGVVSRCAREATWGGSGRWGSDARRVRSSGDERRKRLRQSCRADLATAAPHVRNRLPQRHDHPSNTEPRRGCRTINTIRRPRISGGVDGVLERHVASMASCPSAFRSDGRSSSGRCSFRLAR